MEDNRLLTDEEIIAAIESGYEVIDGVEMRVIHAFSIAKAQDAKTASIKDAEGQARAKRIFKKIERNMQVAYGTDKAEFNKGWWKALKEREAGK